MPATAAILALLIGIAGWFYLFYSKAAHDLAGFEGSTTNARRRRFRRVNGAVLLALAVLFYVGCTINPDLRRLTYLGVWSAVLILLPVVLTLAMIDVRLTASLRRRHRQTEQ